MSRDGAGRWFAGGRPLDESPFHQAMVGTHAIGDLIAADPRWGGRDEPADAPRGRLPGHRSRVPGRPHARAGRADRAGHRPRGPRRPTPPRPRPSTASSASGPATAPATDRSTSRTEPRSGRSWSRRSTLRSLLRGDIEAGERALLTPTQHQLDILKTLRWERRASIQGGAGSGKTLVAVEKARQLAVGGLSNALRLLQPAARASGRRRPGPGPVHHGRDADRHDLPRAVPAPRHRGPHAAAQARATRPGLVGRRAAHGPLSTPSTTRRPVDWHALVIDEGQDFAARLAGDARAAARATPNTTSCTSSTTRRRRSIGPMCRPAWGCASTRLTSTAATRGRSTPSPTAGTPATCTRSRMREGGRAPVIIEAAAGEATVEAVGQVLRDIVHGEKVPKEQVAVLLGRVAAHQRDLAPRPLQGRDRPVERQRGDPDGRVAGPAVRRGAGAAARHDPVRLDPPLQGPRPRGRHPRRAGSGRRAARCAALRRRITGPGTPGRHRAARAGATVGSVAGQRLDDSEASGAGTARTTRSSIPAKSAGFAVKRGRPLAMAVAAIIASNERAAGLRPDRR